MSFDHPNLIVVEDRIYSGSFTMMTR